jgi:hypothetical protein
VSRTLRSCFLVLLLVVCSIVTAAPPPARPPARPLDLTRLPPGAIIVIGDDARDALQQPGVIVLSPEKFKEMLDQIELLKKASAPDKAEAPSRCKISGRVENDIVYLQLQYEFETRKRKALVALGGQKSSANAATPWLTGVALDDGRLPLLPPPGDDGLVVQVDGPGPHKLTLDVELLVTPRGAKGSERGFELGLPRAAITQLDFLDLPVSLLDLRCNGRPYATKDVSSKNGQRKQVPLGATDKLDVVWKGPTPQAAQPLQTAQATLDVRIDDQVTIDAELTLQMKSGQTALWQIQAPPPPQANLVPDLPDNDVRAPIVTAPPPEAKVPIWTIKLKEPSDEPLKVRIRARQPRTGRNVALLPFPVLGAVHQSGAVTVSVPLELRFRARLREGVSQREVPEELRRATSSVALFNYWNLPAPRADQPPQPLIDLEIDTIKGGIETETQHHLRLTEHAWQVSATIDVTPVRMGVEKLELDLPADYAFTAGPAVLVEPELEVKDAPGGRRVGIVKLAQKQTRPFKITLEGVCPLTRGAPPAVIAVPRPLQTFDKGARLTVALPEALELQTVREPGAEPILPNRRERSWSFDTAPPRIELNWRERRTELPVESVVDITLVDWQARVTQRLHFLALPEGQKEVTLRNADLPSVRLADGQPLTARGPGAWTAPLKGSNVTLEYSFTVPEPEKGGRGRRFPVPILWPEGATRCGTKVRLWCDTGTQPVLSSGVWEEQPIEVAAEHDSLPVLVLRSSGLDVPLFLRLAETPGVPLANVTVERVLVQVGVVESGPQTYRARFLLSKIGTRTLDVELPAPVAALNLEFLLDGLRLPNYLALGEDGKESETGRIARLRLEPENYRKPVVLDVRYQMAARGEGQSRFQTTLTPPRLRGHVLLGRVRWLTALPADWVTFCPSSRVSVEQRWGWRGNLPAPRPGPTALDLERWFTAADVDLDGTGPAAELVCSDATLEPLLVLHLPQQVWLLACSLAFLGVGLLLYFATLSRVVFWILATLVGLAVLVIGLLWPSLLPALVFGIEPGVVVLLVVIGVQWLLQRRYRRQLLFMPSFSRLGPGSSIVRNGATGTSSSQRRRDPSTVDVPPSGAS